MFNWCLHWCAGLLCVLGTFNLPTTTGSLCLVSLFNTRLMKLQGRKKSTHQNSLAWTIRNFFFFSSRTQPVTLFVCMLFIILTLLFTVVGVLLRWLCVSFRYWWPHWCLHGNLPVQKFPSFVSACGNKNFSIILSINGLGITHTHTQHSKRYHGICYDLHAP